MLTEAQAEYDWYQAHSAERLQALQQQYAARRNLELWLGY